MVETKAMATNFCTISRKTFLPTHHEFGWIWLVSPPWYRFLGPYGILWILQYGSGACWKQDKDSFCGMCLGSQFGETPFYYFSVDVIPHTCDTCWGPPFLRDLCQTRESNLQHLPPSPDAPRSFRAAKGIFGQQLLGTQQGSL